MSKDTTYNGWTNYETWAMKLWMDNDQGEYNYWRETTRDCRNEARDQHPNQFMDKADNARNLLADALKARYDDESEHPVFEAANGTVYVDLLNAALAEVNWHEIANALLEDAQE